jgi:hypothetical protein
MPAKYGIYWDVVARALLSLVPLFLLFIAWDNTLLLKVCLINISLFIACERLNLNIISVSLHYIFILSLFSILFFSFAQSYLFIILCALMAAGTIYCTQHGNKLRTWANYCFIPAVYLACEMHETVRNQQMLLSQYFNFIKLTPIALLSIIILFSFSAKKTFWSLSHKIFTTPIFTNAFWQELIKTAEIGKPETQWRQGAITIFVGVFLAATLVITKDISRGEWVIWSAASVITGDLISSRQKFQHRLIGAFFGIALGFFATQFYPATETFYSLATIGIMLTLVAFKSYPQGFAARCFFITLAAFAASQAPEIAVERVENVIAGGAIGLLSCYLIQLLITIKDRYK